VANQTHHARQNARRAQARAQRDLEEQARRQRTQAAAPPPAVRPPSVERLPQVQGGVIPRQQTLSPMGRVVQWHGVIENVGPLVSPRLARTPAASTPRGPPQQDTDGDRFRIRSYPVRGLRVHYDPAHSAFGFAGTTAIRTVWGGGLMSEDLLPQAQAPANPGDINRYVVYYDRQHYNEGTHLVYRREVFPDGRFREAPIAAPPRVGPEARSVDVAGQDPHAEAPGNPPARQLDYRAFGPVGSDGFPHTPPAWPSTSVNSPSSPDLRRQEEGGAEFRRATDDTPEGRKSPPPGTQATRRVSGAPSRNAGNSPTVSPQVQDVPVSSANIVAQTAADNGNGTPSPPNRSDISWLVAQERAVIDPFGPTNAPQSPGTFGPALERQVRPLAI